MKFGIAALVLGSSLAPSAGAFSYLSSLAPTSGSSPKNAYSISKSFNPVVAPTAGSSYLDGMANNGVMSASHGNEENVSSNTDDSDMAIRSEYNTWLKGYGKTADESRYVNFKANFLTLQEHGRQTGKGLLLNQFADYSAEEFAQLHVTASATATPKKSYAPGAGGKPAAPTSSGMGSYLSSVTQAAATPQSYAPAAASPAPPAAASSAPVAAVFGASYLSSVSNPAMGSGSPTPKKSYAPGSSVPKRGYASDEDYRPMAPAKSGIGGFSMGFAAQAAMTSFAPDIGTAPVSRSAPAAASSAPAFGSSYLSAVSSVAGSGSPVPKKSYAPGFGSKPMAPASSGIGGSSYLSSVAQPGASVAGSGSPVPKKSYAPGFGSKPMAPASSGIGSSYLSFVSEDASTSFAPVSSSAPAAATHAGANGASYLNSVSTVTGSGSPAPKKSYAPGAGGKSWGPTSSGIGSSYLSSVAQVGGSVASSTTQSYTPSPPAAAVSGASYLNSMSNPAMGSGSPTPKKSYAPGAGVKPMAPASSGIGSSYLSSVAPPAAVVAGASYLNSMSNPAMGSGSPTPKKSYAPGAGVKPMAPASSGIGSSYLSSVAQPGAADAPQSYTPAASGASYLSSVSNSAMGSGSPVPKKGYAPGEWSRPMTETRGFSMGFAAQAASTSFEPVSRSAPAVATSSAPANLNPQDIDHKQLPSRMIVPKLFFAMEPDNI